MAFWLERSFIRELRLVRRFSSLAPASSTPSPEDLEFCVDRYLPSPRFVDLQRFYYSPSLSLSLSHFTHSGYIFHVEANFFHLHGMFLLSEFILKLQIILILILELNGKRAKRMASWDINFV